jgi:hypothetical protein
MAATALPELILFPGQSAGLLVFKSTEQEADFPLYDAAWLLVIGTR